MSPTGNPSVATDDTGDGHPLRFSVIVPIYNRSQELRRLLDALGRQSFRRERFEVVICDDGSVEDLVPVVKQAADEHGLRMVYLRQESRGPGPARNLGLVHARGEIIASTDSDCVPGPDWLVAFDRAFADPALGLAGGPVDYHGARRLSGRCVNFLMSSAIGAGGARDPRVPVAMRFYPRTGNLAVRRDLALAVGGFPGHRSGEDLEFSHRVSQRCGPPQFVIAASVLHDEQSGPAAIFREAANKGAARVRLRRSCGLHQLLHLLPATLIVTLLGSVVTALLWPAARPIAAVPWALYGTALAALAFQGAVALGEFRAIAALPWYASLMHVGYGLGYLAAAAGLVREQGGGYPQDQKFLRRNGPPPFFDPSVAADPEVNDAEGAGSRRG